MSEQELYEALGRKSMALESLQAEYAKLLQVMAHVAAGDIAPERITVDMASRTWQVVAAPSSLIPPKVAERNGTEILAKRRKG